MLTATPAAHCRITTLPELEHEYHRAQVVYRMHCRAGDIAGAMIHLANMMRIWRSLRWVREAMRAHRSAPPLLGPERSPFSGTWQPSQGGLS